MNETRLTIIPNLLVEHGRIDTMLKPAQSISQIMRGQGWDPAETNARVTIDGRLISEAEWEYQLPYSQQKCIVIRRVPMGGGGGGGGKNTGMMIGMLAVMALAFAAPYAAPALVAGLGGTAGMWAGTVAAMQGLGGIALSAGVGIGGMLAMRALIPQPLPRLKEIRHEKSDSICPPSRRLDRARRMSQRHVADDRAAGKSPRAGLAARTATAEI